MKCKLCNSDIDNDAQFCPYCGKKVVYGKQCINCGNSIDDDSEFCPYCGTKQQVDENVKSTQDVISSQDNHEGNSNHGQEVIQGIEEPQKDIKKRTTQDESIPISESSKDDLADTLDPYKSGHSSKKWLWVLGVILLLCVVGYGMFFLCGHSYENDVTAKKTFIESVYMDLFEPNNTECSAEEFLSKHFTKEAMQKCLVEDEFTEGEFYYDTDFLLTGVIGGKGDYGNKVISRTIAPESDDWFLVTNVWDIVQTPLKIHLQVKSVDGVYKIVDLREELSEASDSEATTIESIISIADILGTNGNISLLVERHGFKEQTYISGRGAECHYYYKNCVIEDDNPVPVDKNSAVCIDCTYGIDGEETIIEVYNYNAYNQLVNEVIKLSKGKNGDDYILQWANNQNISVRLYDKGEEYGGSIIFFEPQ